MEDGRLGLPIAGVPSSRTATGAATTCDPYSICAAAGSSASISSGAQNRALCRRTLQQSMGHRILLPSQPCDRADSAPSGGLRCSVRGGATGLAYLQAVSRTMVAMKEAAACRFPG